jgi:nudix-type nucleoside diphosphatase (YffH/AdpP family)
MQRAHDTPAGDNPDVRNLEIEMLSDGWYKLRRATFEMRQPDGSWVREQREAYDRSNGVVTLLHNVERDTILLVRQYRCPVHLNDHPDGMILECPAGIVDPDEDAATAMRRELLEETGHDISELTEVFKLYMSPGSVTEYLTFFAGEYSTSTVMDDVEIEAHRQEHEQINTIEYGFDDAVRMIGTGEICDAKTVLLLQWAQLNRQANSASRR